MTISYIKKANKTASSDEVETRQKVQEVLNEIESKRDEGIKEISRKFESFDFLRPLTQLRAFAMICRTPRFSFLSYPLQLY